jgi:nitroreductase
MIESGCDSATLADDRACHGTAFSFFVCFDSVMRKSTILFLAIVCFCAALRAADLQPITLPAPQTDGGKPLMQALQQRASQREFAPDPLPLQILSNLLWAAWGVNRPDSGRRTAPSAMNRQEMDVYVALAGGVFLYEAKDHRLAPVVPADLRAFTGTQSYVATAPVNLIYVSRASGGSAEDQAMNGGIQAGLISENVYLYCASEGLATVVRGSINRDPLARAMQLPAGRRIILAQTVGYPAKK